MPTARPVCPIKAIPSALLASQLLASKDGLPMGNVEPVQSALFQAHTAPITFVGWKTYAKKDDNSNR